MSFSRSSGILLHPTSLPGRFGIGDLGYDAYRFADFLVESGQKLWQVLPLGPTGYGDSPYQCLSAFAGNTLLISPELLVDESLLHSGDISDIPWFPEERVDFGGVINFKSSVLRIAYDRFKRDSNGALKEDFAAFCEMNDSWLNDYALYRAIKSERGEAPWNTWETELAARDDQALDVARERLHDHIRSEKFYQFLFFRQWSALRRYCSQHDIRLVGDIPIFVAYDSVDVWANPHIFKLNEQRAPLVVAGVPPDYFSKTGQLWGNPIYDWERMRADGYRWWIGRIRAALDVVDLLRIDHFRGFAAYWEVPAENETAESGKWVLAPGRDFLSALKQQLGELPILAEDLGVITPDVEALRDEFGLAGMRVLQFGFRDCDNNDLPHNYLRNTVAYTGTHDNDTCVGWFNSAALAASTRDSNQIERERQHCLEYLNSDGNEIHWDFIRAAMSSVADMAIVPLQDILGLGSDARMNLPASPRGNWSWRFRSEWLTSELAARLRKITRLYARGISQ